MAFERERDVSPIVEGDEFHSRLAAEIERSDRYDHPFTVLILRSPETSGEGEMVGSAWFDSLVSSLVRGCCSPKPQFPERAPCWNASSQRSPTQIMSGSTRC